MTFDVRITINGLCCYVYAPSTGQVHVLMPDTPPPPSSYTPGCAIPKPGDIPTHFPRLLYDREYEKASPGELSRKYVCLDLDGGSLEIPVVASGVLDSSFPPELVNLYDVLGVRLPATSIDPGTRATKARLSFSEGGITDYSLGLCFNVFDQAGKKRYEGPMTTTTTWTIRNVSAANLSGFRGTLGNAIPALRPIRNVIQLYLYHIPDEELPRTRWPIPNYNSNPHHFDHYFNLFPGKSAPMPELNGNRSVGEILDRSGRPHSTVPVDPTSNGCPVPVLTTESLTGTCMSVRADM